MLTLTKTIPGQVEKELEADVYVNRLGIVTHAEFRSPMFEGNKDLFLGGPARNGIKITPRIFGFCGGAHQQAATMALENAWKAKIPPNAKLLRSIAQATEILQNTSRWLYTTFLPDLTNVRFAENPLYAKICSKFTAFQGSSFRPGILSGTHPMALYALIAGQWPHANFYIPGGVATGFNGHDLNKAQQLLDQYQMNWMEGQLLNCTLDRYLEIRTYQDLENWLEEKEAHRQSDLGLFLRAALQFGLDEMGEGVKRFLSYGAFWNQDADFDVSPKHHKKAVQFAAGVVNRQKYRSFDHKELAEALRQASKNHIHYPKQPMEVGSLARLANATFVTKKTGVAQAEIIKDLLEKKGASVFTRAFARIHETCVLLKKLQTWLSEVNFKNDFAFPVEEIDGVGLGLTEAPRGALAHYVSLENGRIKNYQLLPPTIINIKPGVGSTKASPLSEAVKGLEIKNLENPIEVGLVARSFDSCHVCNVNLLKSRSRKPIGEVQV